MIDINNNDNYEVLIIQLNSLYMVSSTRPEWCVICGSFDPVIMIIYGRKMIITFNIWSRMMIKNHHQMKSGDRFENPQNR